MNPCRISFTANASSKLSSVLVSTLLLLAFSQVQAKDLTTARNFLKTYCVSCHAGEKPKGDFDAQPLVESNELKAHLPRWLDVFDQVASAQMPPKKSRKAKRPPALEYRELATWLESAISAASRGGGHGRRLRRMQPMMSS